jgi:hypothetical protein
MGGPAAESTEVNPFGSGLNSGWGFGGPAPHHYSIWPRLVPSDFDIHNRHGRGLD